MLRIVNLILVLTILTAQSAWAINSSTLSNSADGEVQKIYTQTEDQHDGAAESCSHLCHASGHLVGIFSNVNLDILTASDRHTGKLIDFASSINYQPPRPPPQSKT